MAGWTARTPQGGARRGAWGVAALVVAIPVGFGLELMGLLSLLVLAAYLLILSGLPGLLPLARSRWRRGFAWLFALGIVAGTVSGGVLHLLNWGESGLFLGPAFGVLVGLSWSLIALYGLVLTLAGPLSRRVGDPRISRYAWGAVALAGTIWFIQAATLEGLWGLLDWVELWMLLVPTALLGYALQLGADAEPVST